MAEQVPAVVDNTAVIQALDSQAPQEDQPVQAQQNDAVANQVQAVGPVQPAEPAAEMVGSFFVPFTVSPFIVLVGVARLRCVCFAVALVFAVLASLYLVVCYL